MIVTVEKISTLRSGLDYRAKLAGTSQGTIGVRFCFDGQDMVYLYTSQSTLGGFRIARFGGELSPASIREFVVANFDAIPTTDLDIVVDAARKWAAEIVGRSHTDANILKSEAILRATHAVSEPPAVDLERMRELAESIVAMNGSLEIRETGKPTRAVWDYAPELAKLVLEMGVQVDQP